jgi:hypothetical protein
LGATVGNTDKFGIPKIYEDAATPCNNWFLSGANDPRFMEQKIIDAGNGWLKPQNPTELRVEVVSDTTADEDTIDTFDVSKVILNGFLYKAINSPDNKGDWGDIEQTWRFKVIKAGSGTRNGECHIELVPGGYRQTSDKKKAGKDKAVPASCEAMSYHFNIYPLSGRVKFEKDSDHTSGYTKKDPEQKNAVPRFDNGQEVIQKAVLYRVPDSSLPGGYAMKLESYLDMTGTGNSFKKVIETLDNGKWGPTRGGNSECHCSEDVVLNMARVAIGFRCDNMVDFVFKDMSVRSIDPLRPIHAGEGSVAASTGLVDSEADHLIH